MPINHRPDTQKSANKIQAVRINLPSFTLREVSTVRFHSHIKSMNVF